MYLLFLDESGTHAGSHSFALGGVALHEDDAGRLQEQLDQLVIRHLQRVPPNLEEFELHAGEMRNAKKPKVDSPQRASIWASFPRSFRLSLLSDAYQTICDFSPHSPDLESVLFGVVLDASFRRSDPPLERERFAYEVILNKFDVLLKTLRQRGHPNRGSYSGTCGSCCATRRGCRGAGMIGAAMFGSWGVGAWGVVA